MDWKLIQMVPLQDNPKQSLQYTVVRSKLIFFFKRIFQEMLNTLKINERKMEDWRFFVGGHSKASDLGHEAHAALYRN